MREIKFRTWSTVNNVMEVPKKITNAIMSEAPGEINCFVLMQFTGLKDKYGKDIYENDIVKSKTVLGEGVSKIIWDTNSCCFTSKNLGSHIMDKETEFEILGNSFQNSELLESVQE